MKLFSTFFDGFERVQVIKHIEEEVTFSLQYFLLLFLSVIISTLGLIINNNAIIIGAMLLSPLIWPIIGIALATVRSTKNLLRKSVALLFASMMLIILFSFLISLISPFREIGTEILNRINPTVYDLVIALAAGIAATLIICWPKFSDALAGVAVAAALLPPICVTGIGLAFGNYQIAYGSFVLFLTNLASIIFSGIIIFSLSRFYKREDQDYVKRLSLGLFLSFLVILLLGFQLVLSLRQIISENTIKEKTSIILTQELENISRDIKIDNVDINTLTSSEIIIDSDIKAPSHIVITVNDKNEIINKLTSAFNKDVNLLLRITQVVEAGTIDQEKITKQNYQKIIENIITSHAKDISKDILIQSIETNIQLEDENRFVIQTVWRVPEGMEIRSSYQENLVKELKKEFSDSEIDLEISLVRYFQISEEKPLDTVSFTKNVLYNKILEYAKDEELKSNVKFSRLIVGYNEVKNKYIIEFGISIPEGEELEEEYLNKLKKQLSVVFNPVSALDIRLQISTYNQISL